MRRSSRFIFFLAVGSLVIAASSVGGATETPRAAASWHVVQEVLANAGPDPSTFTAVTAQTPSSAWAFETTNADRVDAPIVAWRLTGSTWSKAAFPQEYGSTVLEATGTSPSNVYAATSRGALLAWHGTGWMLVTKFAAINGLKATARGDLWVTGRRGTTRASGGLWHLLDGRWQHPSSRSYGDIDAVSDSAIFSVTNTAIEEFDGTGWHVTSLARLLPAKEPLCQVPGLTGVKALTPTDVWVTAAGNCQDFSGPFRLLHLAGTTWSIAAVRSQYARGPAFSAGGGGLWIPTKSFSCNGCTQMLHLAGGRLEPVPLPLTGGSRGLTLVDVATPPGSTDSIAVGWTLACHHFTCDGNDMRGVILRYGT